MEIVDVAGILPEHPNKAWRYGSRVATEEIILHHFAHDYEGTGARRGLDIVKDAAHYHVSALGWAGIGYNGVVARDYDGWLKLYQCGPWGSARAHTYGKNHLAVGIALAGDFSLAQPGEDWYDSAATFAAFLLSLYPAARLLGHREAALPESPTACPGDLFDLERWRVLTQERRRGSQPNVAPEVEHVPETGHSIGFGFRAYWKEHGGVPIFGYPITEEMQEEGRTVQYFQRARLEYFPEHAGTPHVIQGGLVGVEAYEARYGK